MILFSRLFASSQSKYAVVLHGDAGVMSREMMSTKQQDKYIEKLVEVHHKPDEPGGTGGVITLDLQGNIALDINTDEIF